MTETGVQDRNGKLGEYLELLRLLARELDRSMQAIGTNSLPALEDSITNQQLYAGRLRELAQDLSGPARQGTGTARDAGDAALMSEIRGAAERLQALNRQYAALLKLSSHSVAMMVSLFSSYRGQLQEGTGSRLKHQTWSCQV